MNRYKKEGYRRVVILPCSSLDVDKNGFRNTLLKPKAIYKPNFAHPSWWEKQSYARALANPFNHGRPHYYE